MTQTNITVGICTYKRAHIIQTLISVYGALSKLNQSVEVLVVDNDDKQSAKPLIERFNQSVAKPVRYVCEPNAGVTNARNRILSETDSKWLLIIDDDEVVDKNWFKHYQALIESSDALDGAVGPVITIYPDYVPDTIVKSGVLNRCRQQHLTPLRYGYTGNCLINMETAKQHKLQFDMKFNRTGGEDSDFFERLAKRGNVVWNNNSIVYEALTKERAQLSWVYARYRQNGHSYGVRQLMRKGKRYSFYLFASSLTKLIGHAFEYLVYHYDQAQQVRLRCELNRDLGRLIALGSLK